MLLRFSVWKNTKYTGICRYFARSFSWRGKGARLHTLFVQGALKEDILPLPHIKGTCYPRYLGITRRSCLEAHMVLDMEYREQD
jgi:hypothetical protein